MAQCGLSNGDIRNLSVSLGSVFSVLASFLGSLSSNGTKMVSGDLGLPSYLLKIWRKGNFPFLNPAFAELSVIDQAQVTCPPRS